MVELTPFIASVTVWLSAIIDQLLNKYFVCFCGLRGILKLAVCEILITTTAQVRYMLCHNICMTHLPNKYLYIILNEDLREDRLNV